MQRELKTRLAFLHHLARPHQQSAYACDRVASYRLGALEMSLSLLEIIVSSRTPFNTAKRAQMLTMRAQCQCARPLIWRHPSTAAMARLILVHNAQHEIKVYIISGIANITLFKMIAHFVKLQLVKFARLGAHLHKPPLSDPRILLTFSINSQNHSKFLVIKLKRNAAQTFLYLRYYSHIVKTIAKPP